jgi:hypothetical protein
MKPWSPSSCTFVLFQCEMYTMKLYLGIICKSFGNYMFAFSVSIFVLDHCKYSFWMSVSKLVNIAHARLIKDILWFILCCMKLQCSTFVGQLEAAIVSGGALEASSVCNLSICHRCTLPLNRSVRKGKMLACTPLVNSQTGSNYFCTCTIPKDFKSCLWSNI